MDLERRVEKLEQENRRLKIVGGVVVAVLAAVALVGAVMPQEIPDVIEARSFRAVNENGHLVTLMSPIGVRHFYGDQIPVFSMNIKGIFFSDSNRTTRVRIFEEGIAYFDENGELRAMMDANGFAYLDENRNTRAQLGVAALTSPASGAVTRYPAAVVLYDAGGNVIWQAPR